MSLFAPKYLVIWAVAILAAGLTLLVVRWPQGKTKTFSQHAAAQNITIWYYIGLFAIVLSLLLIFFIKWFVPTFQLTRWFTAFIIVSSIAQFACTLVPEIGGRLTQYHRMLAGVSALMLLPPLVLIMFSDAINLSGRLFVAGCLAVMVGIITLVAFASKLKIHDIPQLQLQAGYFVAFFCSILLVAFGHK